jgi:hypothetical protein
MVKKYRWAAAITLWVAASCNQDETINRPPRDDERGKIVSAELTQTYSGTRVDSILNVRSGGLANAFVDVRYGVDVYTVIYQTIDGRGKPTRASGLIFLPKGMDRPASMVSYQHGTINKKDETPSRNFNSGEFAIGLIMAGEGYVSAIPDYLGLGYGPGMHPYCHAPSEATAVIDMLRATKKLAAQYHLALNGKLFLLGYSQGGHATMAAHKYIETQYSDEFTVTASAPMSGPYDLQDVQAQYIIKDEDYPDPSYLPYVIFGYRAVYPELMENPYDFFKPEYAATLPDLFNGEYNSGYINRFLPTVPNQMMRADALKLFKSDVHSTVFPFRMRLRESNTYLGWTPKAPIKMLYCSGDRSVAWQNAAVALDYFRSRGATNVEALDVSPGTDHVECALPALLEARAFFKAFD